MARSIGGFLGRSGERRNLLVKGISKLLRHIVVEPEPRHNGGLRTNIPILIDASPVGRQAYNVMTSPVSAGGNSVDYKLTPFSQIDEVRLV